MICDICGKDQEGCRVEIVTGTNIETKTLRYGTGTSTTHTFSNFKPMEFWFCQECWRALKRKNDKTELIITGISFVICLILVIVGSVSNSNLGMFAFILGLISLIAFIYDLYKRLKTDYYSQLIMQDEKPKTIFTIFREVISTLVYKARGKTYFWDRETWQDWTAKGNAPTGAWESKP